MTRIWQISVDTGGTFTDCIAMDPTGKKHLVKVLSSGRIGGHIVDIIDSETIQLQLPQLCSDDLYKGYKIFSPKLGWQSSISSNNESGEFKLASSLPPNLLHNPLIYLSAEEEAPILAARIATQTQLNQDLPEIDFRLGTTKGTNALLEGKGSRTALIVSKGFKDLLNIGTQQRPDLFALNIKKRQTLPEWVIEIDESISSNGHIDKGLSTQEINACVKALKETNCQVVAIALKNSYVNPEHEILLKTHIDNELNLHITSSAQLFPAIKYLTRTETAVVNAYLSPVLEGYLSNISSKISADNIRIMTSSGALSKLSSFNAKDSLLSGPAGGIVGAANTASGAGFSQVLTIDMGGTSTDVSRYAAGYDYVSELEVGDAHLFTQALAIETVAAGGGSICHLKEGQLQVGPDSAGANPGPACYGNGGPLSVTDLNLLSNRIDPESFGFPINRTAAEEAFDKLFNELKLSQPESSKSDLLSGFLAIANQKMADAVKKISINKGFDPKEYQLLGFGGAIGQHICDIADLLGVSKIIIPYEGSLLSAAGIASARVERHEIKQILKPLSNKAEIEDSIDQLTKLALKNIKNDGIEKARIGAIDVFMRLIGQDTTLEVRFETYEQLAEHYKRKYIDLFGHWVERDIEVESIRVTAQEISLTQYKKLSETRTVELVSNASRKILFKEGLVDAKLYDWSDGDTSPGSIDGPAVFSNPFTSIIINANWHIELKGSNLIISKDLGFKASTRKNMAAVDLALYTNRFKSVAEQMGSLLQRTALSVNIKERLDFSCALLDNQGRLVVNAPHIPVHLGSLGICTRSIINKLSLNEGDVVITNHPAYGGSHLPDVTLIAPVHFNGTLIGYVANRAHHAEIGGKAPGSMPADAKNLSEEGVVIPPTLLIKSGKANWPEVKSLLTTADYPTRALEDNIADFQASLASIIQGQKVLINLAQQYGMDQVVFYMKELSNLATSKLDEKLSSLSNNQWFAQEQLDNGASIEVNIQWTNKLSINFEGTSSTVAGNLNATEAIVNGAVIYLLKLLIDDEIPLNEGLMRNVELLIPSGSMLNPVFPANPQECPAVVGGNTEVSQRLVDTLLKAFGLAACSQGTMNNFLFGSDNFGYYETICGGTGAGISFHGTDAVHQHMTNTQITDPEILEFRYPVKLEEFSIRQNSGGAGEWTGGNGVRRRFCFSQPVTITFLTQHRKIAPYGLRGGSNGSCGEQYLIRNKTNTPLNGVGTYDLKVNDKVEILTPGGGGYGPTQSGD